ncbi:MAG: hypothetical protein LBV41_01805 [Cytophagaceae bacterium]|nr:hypothetical protein [Cytophagaceae bacterium]
MVTAKIIKVNGGNAAEIDETTTLLQDFLDKVSPADVRKLLLAVKQKPTIVKTALKFL